MVQRIVEELKCRGYNVWFGKSRATLIARAIVFLLWLVSTDIEMMKGSVIECMSAAIEGAVGAEIQTLPVSSCLHTPVRAGGDAIRSVRSLQRVSQLRKTKPTSHLSGRV